MAENEQKTPKKFRVRFKKDPSGNIEPGEIFIEERSKGTTVLKTNYYEEALPISDLGNAHNKIENGVGDYARAVNYYTRNMLNSGISVVNVSAKLKGVTTEVDLNTYTEGGIYFISDSRLTIVNGPDDMTKGYLIVIEWNSTEARQIFIENNGSSEKTFIRGRSGQGNDWSNWKEILTTVHKSDLIKEAREEIKSGWYQIKEKDWDYKNEKKAWEYSGKIKYSTPYKEDCTPVVVASLATNYPLKANVSIDIVEESNRKNEFKFVVQSTITDSGKNPGNMSFYWISTISNYQKDESKAKE